MLVEADTLTAALAGDREALGRKLQSSLRHLTLHLSGRIGSAYQSAVSIEDVLQVTLIEACLRINTLEDRSSEGLLRWLKVVAENNLRDVIRELKAGKRPQRDKQVGQDYEESAVTFLACLVASGTTPTQGARRSELAALLEQALSELPPDYARAIRGYDIEGRSIEEVAASFDPPKSTGAVHMLRARGKDRLRQLLGDTSQFFSGCS